MTGKTSLVKTFVAKSRRDDTLVLYLNLLGARGIRDFLARLSEALSCRVTSREISLKLPSLEVTQASRLVENLFSQLRTTRRRVMIALDEVQELYRVSGPFLKLLKMIHDSYPNVSFIFTGSMFGLMRVLLQPEVSSPMYGRKPAKVELAPFSEETSLAFLRKGSGSWGFRLRRRS